MLQFSAHKPPSLPIWLINLLTPSSLGASFRIILFHNLVLDQKVQNSCHEAHSTMNQSKSNICSALPLWAYCQMCCAITNQLNYYRPITALSLQGRRFDIVTLIPKFPFSLNICAMLVSKTKQSLFWMAALTPSWIERGVASHNSRLPCPLSSSL